MLRSFFVEKSFHLHKHELNLGKGDVLVYNTRATENLAVYRGQRIVKSVTITEVGIRALAIAGIISEVTGSGATEKDRVQLR